MLEVTNSDIDMNSFYEDRPFRFKLKAFIYMPQDQNAYIAY